MGHIGFEISHNLVTMLVAIALFVFYLILGTERINTKLIVNLLKAIVYFVVLAFGAYYLLMLYFIFSV
jgi:hypothetical protein